MKRLAATFSACHNQNRSALITYLMAGDPSPEATVVAMHALVEGGADVLELGMPFSDPTADGPSIEQAHHRALAAGTTMEGVLAMVRRFREGNDHTPVILMGYLNPIEQKGPLWFAQAAATSGVDGALVVDLPPEEAGELRDALANHGLAQILLAAPTTPPSRLAMILREASGFVYYITLKGTTGADRLEPAAVVQAVTRLRAMTELPIVVGFGVRTPQQAAELAACADGVVVGSVVVEAMAQRGPEHLVGLAAGLSAALSR
jgi:tryptophan synthase alpha chain